MARALDLRSVLILSLCLGIVPAVCPAATATWSTTAADGSWANDANWVGGHHPNPGDDLVFPATSTVHATSNDLTAGFAVSTITFHGGGYTLGGNAIAEAGEILCGSDVSGTNVMNVPMTVSSVIVLGVSPGCTMDLEGAIDGAGGIFSTGGGAVILGGIDTYGGQTKAGGTGGVLIVNGSLTDTSAVLVNESSGNPMLGGHGTINAPVNVENAFPADIAVISPGQGASTGILSTGSLSLGTSSLRTALIVKLNGTTPGTDYDQVQVNGNLALGEVFLDVRLGFVPTVGTEFTIVKNIGGSPGTGTFKNLPEGQKFVVGGSTFQIGYAAGASGDDVVLTTIDNQALPTALDVDAAGDGVLEVGESASLAPTWMNTSGGPAHLQGSMSLFTGPSAGGTAFNVDDGTGDYGTIADGGSGACTDCYAVSITAATRPGQHWDARIDENIAPFSLVKTWTLHVGGSFADVPTSQQFYKFIENLFHNGVTGGCAGGNYCPGNAVTRGQMAAFLLKGEHGGNYAPPACSSTMFLDVPCPGAQFVDFINQLAAEGITGGCGNGNYCPGSSVTRGQMAVFLLKGEHGGGYAPPACSATMFTDVPCPGAQFVDFINQLATEGVTGGCGGGNYCPANPVNRGQMAAFLVKTFQLALYGP
jgi:S-layer family protein